MSYFDDNEDYLTGLHAPKGLWDAPALPAVTCRNCGKKNLHWEDDGDGSMILMEGPWKLHNCKQADVDAFQTADFEKLD